MKFMRIALIFILLLLIALPAGAAETAPFTIDATAAVLLDYDSGQVLFNQLGDQEHIPASLVKIMTMYVALDQVKMGHISLDETTTITENAWRMSGSQMFLEIGEEVTIDDLLYGIAVVSGNDASVALAEAISGSADVFVNLMNNKARDLGLNLTFVDVHGLSEENTVTALDVAKLARAYLQEHPESIKYHTESSLSYQPRSRNTPIVQYNRNGLLKRYDGADGLKTGHLRAAGYNLVATAKNGERRLIAVILGGASERGREQEAITMLNYGFRNFTLVDSTRFLDEATIPVHKGSARRVGVIAAEPMLTIPQGTETGINVSVQTNQLTAPVSKGQVVGTLTVRYEGSTIQQTPLLAENSVERGGVFRIMWDSLVIFFRNLIQRP